MNIDENTDWGKSVAGVVVKDGKVLLARHTYGAGKGMLIVPGGYINIGEMPEEAVRREIMEETGINAAVTALVGIKFSKKEWYAVFLAEYISGEARSDGDENSEVVWLDINEALTREDVPDLSKKIIACALKNDAFKPILYKMRDNSTESRFYGSR